ncbi:tRNA:m(4)X modification enzyme TRM13 homolog isoform X2 [Pristis pectinata]|uniref:tRNA:m(4)X modification enzyme TRM13 homolog isoform X2 n=1 Tax=Pristis pectinata TaxID=685728 RepID=UPI00223DDA70|nr:tRNA:m(4)X modification enzyme TRM13 homolog isoform X2 [Pristis pectinata]XP_051866864.1 tRNA:m(4)X modification enzyme TRM13 homolog isoform X2 [Pristis pectinata]
MSTGPKTIYYSKGINGGDEDAVETTKQQVSICALSKEELEKMIRKLLKATSSLDSQLTDQTSTHRALEEALNDPKNGEYAIKHLKQKASLAGNLERLGLLGSNRCFVEFGAGRGKLSHWIDLALQDAENVHFLLVERATTRFKVDGKHRRQGSTFERLQIDIEDLNLSNVPLLTREKLPVVGIGKHLCGAATDLALRCILKSYKTEQEDADKEPLKKRLKSEEMETTREDPLNLPNCIVSNIPNGLSVLGIAIALCCHHRCEWKHYVGKEFFSSQGLGAEDFKIFQRLSSWATCGMKRHSIDISEEEFGNANQKVNLEEHNFEEESIPYGGTLTVEEREHVGRLCKRLIDQGRIWYLQQQGFDSALQYYISPSISLENVLLTAIPLPTIQQTEDS